jgi:plasmid stability protein
MRTTISVDDRIFEAVKRRAAEQGLSVSAFVAKILDDAMKRELRPQQGRPFRLVTVSGGGPYPGVDLDRPRELMVAEDEERYR